MRAFASEGINLIAEDSKVNTLRACRVPNFAAMAFGAPVCLSEGSAGSFPRCRLMKPTCDPKLSLAGATAQVRGVYAELESRPVARECTGLAGCCQFKLTGLIPSMTRGEAVVATAALRATGRKRLPESAGGACPMLDASTRRCMIYDGRPFGCRTHFCRAAGGPLARREVLDLIRRLEEVDMQLGHRDGPRPLPAAMAAELGC